MYNYSYKIKSSLKCSKKKQRKKNIKLANTSGYMIYGIFKCYNVHFNNYLGFSIIIIKNEENRTTFSIDRI